MKHPETMTQKELIEYVKRLKKMIHGLQAQIAKIEARREGA